MSASFIETTGFTEAITDLLPDDAYARLQQQLLENPDSGDVMPSCGGLLSCGQPTPRGEKGSGAAPA